MGTGKNRAGYYEYALGSARESRDWYNKGRHNLPNDVFEHRVQLLAEILRLLLTMVPQQRERTLREESAEYETASDDIASFQDDNSDTAHHLTQNIPLP